LNIGVLIGAALKLASRLRRASDLISMIGSIDFGDEAHAIFSRRKSECDWKTANQDLAACSAAKNAHFNAVRFSSDILNFLEMAFPLRAAL
jgi:hypothetical protein